MVCVVMFILLVCVICLFDFFVVAVVISWVGLILSFSSTCSSSHQFTIIVEGFIVVPPSSCPTSILIAYARRFWTISRSWQKRFLSARESKLMRMHWKFVEPSCLSLMSMW